ncbi:MAG: hypothetical protein IPM32_01980 [Ignavibacteriae bacterium]|nr:hypothetical protein [Ignavibacteriota bacterium]
MNKYKFSFVTVIIIAAVVSRFVPHPYNFTPISAIALFGGAYFSDKKLSFIVPLLAMFLSDLYLGMHSLIPFVYASFVIIVFLGFQLRDNKSITSIAFASIIGSVIFFVLTNFAVWVVSNYYPKTIEGFIACFVAAIPFFHNNLFGDLIYTAMLFGSFKLLKNYIPKLEEVKIEN